MRPTQLLAALIKTATAVSLPIPMYQPPTPGAFVGKPAGLGALAGAGLGAGVHLLSKKDPKRKHFDWEGLVGNMVSGAGVGGLAGGAYGMHRYDKALDEENRLDSFLPSFLNLRP